MNKNGIEGFAATVNDMDNRLPKGRSRCFDIGTWGGCGATCAAFVDGECGEPQELSIEEIIEAQGHEDAHEIMERYPEGTWEERP